MHWSLLHLRFYLSRLVDMIFPKIGEITHIKDPSIFENILSKRLEFSMNLINKISISLQIY